MYDDIDKNNKNACVDSRISHVLSKSEVFGL